MTYLHRAQNPTFNALLFRLNEIAIQLAQQYQEDVEAALNKNIIPHPTLGDRRVDNVADGQHRGRTPSGRQRSLSEMSASSDSTANDLIPMEVKCQEGQAPEKIRDMHDPPETDIESDQSSRVESEMENDRTVSVVLEPSAGKVGSGASVFHEPSAATDTSKLSGMEAQLLRTKSSTVGRFHMRSPWIDHRDLDNVSLVDVMSEDMYLACVNGTVQHNIELFDKQVFVQSGSFSCLICHPESRTRGCWVVACMILLLYDFIMIPIDVCFDLEETAFTRGMDVTSATFWTADIVFTFFVGVVLQHTVEMNPTNIAYIYLKSWFLFDVLLVIPEWLTVTITNSSFSAQQVAVFRIVRWWRFMRVLRMARILKSGRFKPVLRRLIYVLNLTKVYLQLMQALAGLSFALVAFIHISSCLWYAVGNSSDDGWVSVNGLKSATVAQAYAASIHWSFSRLHGMQAYNEMESVTDFVLDAFLIYVSLILAAYYSGTLAAVAMTNAKSQSLNLWKLSILFTQRHQISPRLDQKMTKFLECSMGGASEIAGEELTLLEALPKALQHDLLFEVRAPFLTKKTFLKDLLAANPRVIHRICYEAVVQKLCVDGEFVFKTGDACHGMLFISSGVLFYTLGNSAEPSVNVSMYNMLRLGRIHASLYSVSSKLSTLRGSSVRQIKGSKTKQLEANASVSEPVLWTHWTHVGSLTAIVETILFVLSPFEFSKVLSEHYEVFCYAFKYAKRFLWELNHAMEVDDLTAYREINLKDLDTQLFDGTEYDHLMFLSHYKVEAGTEATLMCDLLQKILREDPHHPANNLRSPIFVDSEDLTDLSKLKEHVEGSTALVLLLTPGVLSRPWCLVEIVTAAKHNVNIVPVDIQRPGSKYNYPDDQFYANLLDGKFLNQAALDLLEAEGISLPDVERAIRKVFSKIAVSFSPHKTKGVREAELQDILSRSRPEQSSLRMPAKL